MAIEVLDPQPGFTHRPGHDLESLLNSMLTICHYTTGPGGQFRQPLPGDERIRFNTWFTTSNRDDLACTKSITLEAFKTRIKPHLPQYWQDFAPFLTRLIKKTWNELPYLEHPNVATHTAYRDILNEALEMYARVDKDTPCAYAFVPPSKRPREDPPPEVRHSKVRRGSKGHYKITRRPTVHRLQSYQESVASELHE